MSELTCPNCGDRLPEQIRAIAMMTCPSCATTLFVDGPRLHNAGHAGDMHDSPALFAIGDTVHLGKATLEITGQARFSYGRGWWDEYWAFDEDRRGAWVSVDEGDVVLQYPIKRELWPRVAPTARIGTPFRYLDGDWRVTETDKAECIAIRGAFGEALEVGEVHSFLSATGPRGDLLSGEFWEGGQSWFIGYWYDPFEIDVKVAS